MSAETDLRHELDLLSADLQPAAGLARAALTGAAKTQRRRRVAAGGLAVLVLGSVGALTLDGGASEPARLAGPTAPATSTSAPSSAPGPAVPCAVPGSITGDVEVSGPSAPGARASETLLVDGVTVRGLPDSLRVAGTFRSCDAEVRDLHRGGTDTALAIGFPLDPGRQQSFPTGQEPPAFVGGTASVFTVDFDPRLVAHVIRGSDLPARELAGDLGASVGQNLGDAGEPVPGATAALGVARYPDRADWTIGEWGVGWKQLRDGSVLVVEGDFPLLADVLAASS